MHQENYFIERDIYLYFFYLKELEFILLIGNINVFLYHAKF